MNDFSEKLLSILENYYEAFIALIPKLGVAFIVFFVLLITANLISRLFTKRLATRLDDPLLTSFLARMSKFLIILIAVLVVLQIIGLGNIASSILATAGVGAFVIGFAFKDIGENFLAGIMLAFNRPFKLGDLVELDGQKGKVITLNLRDSQIKTFDGRDIYIPNANIVKNVVVNYTIDGFLRYDFTVGLDYGSDVSQAIDIILKSLKKIDGILWEEKAPTVGASNLGTSSLELQVFYWLDTFDKDLSSTDIKTAAIDTVLADLTVAGYYMPGNVIELKNYNKDSLKSSKDQ